MTNTEKEKSVKLGGLQAHTRDLFNKGIGSEGTCSTAGDTAAKEVTLGTTFELVSKATILVKFTNAISVANATLAVTHTDLDGTTTTEDAKPIYYRGAALAANLVKAGDSLILRYDGTSWNILGVLDQDMTDTYPDLTAGNVIGEFSDTGAEFAYRPTAGAVDIESGQADYGGHLETIKGNTIAWNQLVQNGDFSQGTTGWENESGVSMSASSNILTNTITDNTALGRPSLRKTDMSLVDNHVYYVKASVLNSSNTTCHTLFSIGLNRLSQEIELPSGEWINNKAIVKTTTLQNPQYFVVYIGERALSLSVGDSFSFKNVQLIDLTLIYGEGNEPTTVEAFEADYQKWFGKPLTYEEYDEGSLRNVKMTGIKTVGFNQWDGEKTEDNRFLFSDGSKGENNYSIISSYIPVLPNTQYYLKDVVDRIWSSPAICWYDSDKNYISGISNDSVYTQALYNKVVTSPANAAYLRCSIFKETADICCINLHHSGDKDGQYESYWESTLNVPITTLKGKLNGQGSSVVVFPDGMKKAGTVYDEIVRRGDKTYAIKRVGSVDLGSLNYTKGYFYYSAFPAAKPSDNSVVSNVTCAILEARMPSVMTSTNGVAISASHGIMIHIGSYEDTPSAADFKVQMSGVILNYELATSQEYLLDDFELPQNYDVDDYGTEEILLGTDGVAPILDLKYGINAGDTIKNLPHSYVSAVGEQNFTEAQKKRARTNIGAISTSDIANMFANLPTTDPEVVGALWNDGGTVKISAGAAQVEPEVEP